MMHCQPAAAAEGRSTSAVAVHARATAQRQSCKRRRLSPAEDALAHDPDGTLARVLCAQGSAARQLPPSHLPAPLLTPERPVAFPKCPAQAWIRMDGVAGSAGAEGGARWPRSLVSLFQMYRIADHLRDHVLASLTPRLLDTIVRACTAIDVLLPKVPTDTLAVPTGWALEQKVWQDSERCGHLALRVDRHLQVVSGHDANGFWSERMAGLHREEFLSRSFAGEHHFPTSELRQLTKAFEALRMWVALLLQQQQRDRGEGGCDDLPPTRTAYYRFSRNFARTDRGPGVLLRVRFQVVRDPHDGWLYLRQSMVELSAAEYEAARAVDPEACEGYMIPLVGSKSAAELLAPRLAEEESLAFLSASEEGRAVLDRLAATIERDYAFVFAAAAAKVEGAERCAALRPQAAES